MSNGHVRTGTTAQPPQRHRSSARWPDQGAPADEITVKEAMDPRIDVFAQYALRRLDTAGRREARDMLSAVKAGQLGGIYKEDEKVPALSAQRHGRGWWQLIPKSEDAILLLEANAPFDAPPLIVFRDRVRSNPAQLDPALVRAWNSFVLWRDRKLGPCGGLVTAELGVPGAPVTNVVPEACLRATTPVTPISVQPSGPTGSFTLPPDPGNHLFPARALVHATTLFPADGVIRRMEDLIRTVATRKDGWIYIANWHAEHDLLLPSGSRLSDVLESAAKAGATIRGLFWDPIPPAIRPPTVPGIPKAITDRVFAPIAVALRRSIGSLFLKEPRINHDTADFITSLPGGVGRLDDSTLFAGSHHHKILAVGNADRTHAVIGGVDWNSDRLRVVAPGNPLFDVSVEVDGLAASDVAAHFERRWNANAARAAIALPTRVIPTTTTPRGATVQIGVNYGCGRPFKSVPRAITSGSDLIENLFRNCREFFYVECQYGLGNAQIEAAIRQAFENGARFGIVVLAGTAVVSDFPEVHFRRHQFWSRFPQIDTDLLVFERFGDNGAPTGPHAYVHSKVVLVDDRAVSIGTLNLSRRSWRHDTEITAVVSDATAIVREFRVNLWPHHLTLNTIEEIRDPGAAFAVWRDVHAGRRPMPRIRPLKFGGKPPPRLVDELLAKVPFPVPGAIAGPVRTAANTTLDNFHNSLADPLGPSTCATT